MRLVIPAYWSLTPRKTKRAWVSRRVLAWDPFHRSDQVSCVSVDDANGLVHGAGMGDDDDDDPYGAAPSTGLDDRHYAFDAAEEEDDVIVMGGAPSSRNPRDTVGGAASSEGYWHDGRPVLVGFVLDIKGVPADKW
jgi:hypothetical protein